MAEPSAPSGASSPRRRTVIASYGSYREAERAVDFLSDEQFPVEHVAIVGSGLRTVEQVAGRLTVGRAALAGARQGAIIGLLFALLLGLFFTIPEAFIGLVIYGLVGGAVFGAILGAVAQAAQGGRRDFASVSGMQAEHYELQVDEEFSARAGELLARQPTS